MGSYSCRSYWNMYWETNLICPYRINLPSPRSRSLQYEGEKGEISATGARWGQIYSMGIVNFKQNSGHFEPISKILFYKPAKHDREK